MKSCLPFSNSGSGSMAPGAAGCAGGGPDCSGSYSGGTGFCTYGAGLLPEPPGFPMPPTTASQSGPSGPVTPCSLPLNPLAH